MTTVKITETYDLRTSVNKIGLIGVHTPQLTLLRKLYPGLMKNHRFVRFVKCDVAGACASVLPADPLQIGVTAGDVAPEDMFNPILYTAVTNESFDSIVARVYGLTGVSALGSVDAGDVASADSESMFKAYYALLSENGKYRKVMPQSGFMIKGLTPLAHTLISPFGNVMPQGNSQALSEDGETPIPVPDMDNVPKLNDVWTNVPGPSTFYRGRAVRMPKFPLHLDLESVDDIPYPNIPKTYVLAMIIPPARLNQFYYRMRVTWTVRFEEVCSTLEAGNFGVYYSDVGANARGTNYTYESSKSELPGSTDTVDTDSVDIEKIMES